MVINEYENKKREIETSILWGLPVLPFLFLIYISMVFDGVKKNNLRVISFSFVDDLRFIVAGIWVEEIAKTLEMKATLVFE